MLMVFLRKKICFGLMFAFFGYHACLGFDFNRFSNDYNNLNVLGKIEVLCAAGKLSTAILSDVCHINNKEKAALFFKTIYSSSSVLNTLIKIYDHCEDVTFLEMGFGIYDLFELIKNLKQNKKTSFEQESNEDDSNNREKRIFYCLLKYSFIFAEAEYSVLFSLDNNKACSYRNIYSWLSTWARILSNSIDTKKIEISEGVPVYLALVLISNLFANIRRVKKMKKSLHDILKDVSKKYQEEIITNIEKEIKSKQEELKNTTDPDMKEQKNGEIKSLQSRKEFYGKYFLSKLGKKMEKAPNNPHIINNVLREKQFSDFCEYLKSDGTLLKKFNEIDPRLINLFE
ncbi:hypothetical protein GF322_01410 [Candidatus Dependentiae bacterium]|nr:hypothetical protein [Candidatus Dependentiae bacterium]